MGGTGKVVLVTGASGYLAGHVVQQLLERGYHVKGTVRKVGGASSSHLKIEDLVSQDVIAGGAKLELVEADLTVMGSFDEAVKGCDYVIHTASPFLTSTANKNPEENLLKPAVQGTENVLNACKKESKVKRVVLTSSTVSTNDSPLEYGEDHIIDENDWNNVSSVKRNPYAYSKVLAERKAWEIAETADWDLVTINPGFIMGPSLSNRWNDGSIGFMQNVLSGKLYFVPNIEFGVVDVRDVAKAHIEAMSRPEANGRYICVAENMFMKDMTDLLRPEYKKKWLPRYKVPKAIARSVAYMGGLGLGLDHGLVDVMGVRNRYCNDKIKKDLGMEFKPMKTTMIDMADSLTKDKEAEKK